MNEELQSTNEELQTVNEELRQRSEELDPPQRLPRVGMLGEPALGAVVVERELDVEMWNHRAEDLWGLRADEVQGKHLLGLDIGLPVEQLRQPILSLMQSPDRHGRAQSRRDQPARAPIALHVSLANVGEAEHGLGIIVLMQELNLAVH